MKRFFCLYPIILSSTFLSAQVGINTETPQKSLHVNGSMQITNELNVGGNGSKAGDPGVAGQVLVSNGSDAAPSWQTILTQSFPNLATGTVIAINGKLIIAQEITVQMSDDYSFAGATSGNGVTIGNLNSLIIDNENTYTGTTTTNSFKVSEDGIYSITMNMQLVSTNNTKPVIGIWDQTADNWIARVNDNFTAATNGLQTYTLITSISMSKDITYSFRFFNTAKVTIKARSEGFTGNGPVSQISIKRLK